MNFIKHIALAGAVVLAPAFALAQAPATGTGATTPPAATKPASGPVGAKGDHRHQRGERFKAADKDGDGAISKAEADAAGMKRVSKNFDKLDANKDGKVTREEFRTARLEHREHKGPRGAKPAAPATPATPAVPATPPATK